ncbi:MAG: hypothetical protein COW01_13425 [Bdellovibrionales bacterium CG12_big_fil_rev_8_21_14_0_65_38_15]|nr:MAG: hypothetical protein COW79_16240 [Bdellovibrionales bacterium CG22_combo_CG10-13_8_21_14_all_38_13]PIQ53275.1 MAG: hypothetical protein COW01_13425 [Bdellovibrionales bacterium CG12_big_fil_rev_8_21_14_0_65_38_15]
MHILSENVEMNYYEQLDFYCERLMPGFWAEPINALSNIGFIFAGLFGFYCWKSSKSTWMFFLSFLALLVGIGSFLFHTYATRWAHLADLLPIALFMSSFLVFVQKRLLHFSNVRTLIVMIVFITCAILIEIYQPRHLLGGSLGYTHAVIALSVVTYHFRKKRHPYTKYFSAGLQVFLLSLIFRTLDGYLCELNPFGSHFIWHLMNAALIFILLIPVDLTTRLNHEP